MKKFFLILLIAGCIILSGCGKYDEKDVINDLSKKINKANSYKITGLLEITNNSDTYQYDVSVSYKKDDNYRVSLINKSNNHEQIILKNSEGVYVVTPSLNKSFKFQSEWPNNNSQIYLLKSLLEDIKNDENREFKKEKDDYIFETVVNYPNNNQLAKQRIILDKKLNFKLVEVMNKDDIAQMIMTFKDIDIGSNFNDDYFDLDSIIEKIEPKTEEQDDAKTSSIDDIIYPLYIPTGTSLTNKEKVSKTDGERIILTFDGEKPFLLVEETSEKNEEFLIIPTFGEPYQLIDTVGVLTNNSITWSSNGIDYYIVSDVMSQIELIEIAASISAIPTMK